MAKKIKLESFKYRFLIAARQETCLPGRFGQPSWKDFVRKLEFSYDEGKVRLAWGAPNSGAMTISPDETGFYLRGDDETQILFQRESGFLNSEDPVKLKNGEYFKELALRVAQAAGYKDCRAEPARDRERFAKESAFHDAWAGSEDIADIEVRAVNEACTAPEMRYITRRLGNIRGKRLLDVGCGLGEASVYFALLGANVTSSDLSQNMLDAASRLAHANGVSVTPLISAAEDLGLSADAQFDIIYAGNLLHHVDIDRTLSQMKPHLAPGGIIATWDPLAYNPVINIYRAIATGVRTADEHPLRADDIRLFRKHFKTVETRYFWLSTLLIFMLMVLVQGRNPNKERFWKVVVREEKRWRRLYQPLEKIDRFLLGIFPPLRLLCWNVVVVCKI